MRTRTPHHDEHAAATERRQQVGAAIGLGLLVLAGVVLRAGLRNVFPVDWWRLW